MLADDSGYRIAICTGCVFASLMSAIVQCRKNAMVHEVSRTPPQAVALPSIWAREQRPLTLGLLLVISGAAFESLAVATTLPAIIRELGGLNLYGWAFSAFMLANLLGITLAGAEADRDGPARPLALGGSIFILGLLIVGLAPAILVVIAGRAVQGFGAGMLSSVVYVSIGRGYPEALKPRMLAMTSTAWVVPGLVGPALAGIISDTVGWRWVFLGLIPLVLLGMLMAYPGLRHLANAHRATRDWRTVGQALALAAGVGMALAALSTSSLVLASVLGIAGIAIAAPPLRQLVPAGTLRAKAGLPAAIATHGLLNLAFFGVDAFVPLAITNGRGQSATVAGLALTAATICWTAGSWVQAHFAARQSRRLVASVGLALIGVGIVGSAAALSPATPLMLALVAWGVAGLGMGLAFSTMSLVVLETAPAGQEGAASSALQLANTLGVALGAGLGGAIIGNAEQGGVSISGLVTHDLLMLGVTGLALFVAQRLPARQAADHVVH